MHHRHITSFEWMEFLAACCTELKATRCTLAKKFDFIDLGRCLTLLHRTPAIVVHTIDSLPNAELDHLLDQLLRDANSLQIFFSDECLTAFICRLHSSTPYLLQVAALNTLTCVLSHTLLTKTMQATLKYKDLFPVCHSRQTHLAVKSLRYSLCHRSLINLIFKQRHVNYVV